jgi:hypothetical protein
LVFRVPIGFRIELEPGSNLKRRGGVSPESTESNRSSTPVACFPVCKFLSSVTCESGSSLERIGDHAFQWGKVVPGFLQIADFRDVSSEFAIAANTSS